MNTRRLLALLGICAILCLSVALFTGEASAQDSSSTKKMDQGKAQKRGVSGALETRGDDDEEDDGRPSKLQMGVGIGSFFVMFAVMKYL